MPKVRVIAEITFYVKKSDTNKALSKLEAITADLQDTFLSSMVVEKHFYEEKA